MPKEAAGSS
jgi:hypothetical protein